jgi:taurine dioxygenase
MVTIRPSGKALGADVEGVDISKPITHAEFGVIQRAWMEHLVLRFRGQTLDDDQLVAFSRNFGALDKAPKHAEQSLENKAGGGFINVISNVVENGKPIGSLGAGEAVWHTDMSYNELPPTASALYSLEIPPEGGNTGFCNMYLAYETLPIGIKERIENLSCIHDASTTSAGGLRKGYKVVTDPRETVGALHPIVRTHPVTGRRCLFLGRRLNAYIPGLDLADSEALLDQLWAHATQDRFTWIQEWRIGDLVMWDNRCTMHRRDEFDPNSRRVMHRTQVSGDRPF